VGVGAVDSVAGAAVASARAEAVVSPDAVTGDPQPLAPAEGTPGTAEVSVPDETLVPVDELETTAAASRVAAAGAVTELASTAAEDESPELETASVVVMVVGEDTDTGVVSPTTTDSTGGACAEGSDEGAAVTVSGVELVAGSLSPAENPE